MALSRLNLVRYASRIASTSWGGRTSSQFCSITVPRPSLLLPGVSLRARKASPDLLTGDQVGSRPGQRRAFQGRSGAHTADIGSSQE
jgi:hypothetical protein